MGSESVISKSITSEPVSRSHKLATVGRGIALITDSLAC
jgi:hypothetical protein